MVAPVFRHASILRLTLTATTKECLWCHAPLSCGAGSAHAGLCRSCVIADATLNCESLDLGRCDYEWYSPEYVTGKPEAAAWPTLFLLRHHYRVVAKVSRIKRCGCWMFRVFPNVRCYRLLTKLVYDEDGNRIIFRGWAPMPGTDHGGPWGVIPRRRAAQRHVEWMLGLGKGWKPDPEFIAEHTRPYWLRTVHEERGAPRRWTRERRQGTGHD